MGSECYVSAIYVGEIDAEEIGLSVTRGSTSDLKTNTQVSVLRKDVLNSACMALLVHLLLLFLLALSWEKAEIRLGADAVKEPKKVSAYFITPEQLTRLMVNKTLKSKEEINQAITPPAPIEPEVMLGTKTNTTQVSVPLDDGIHNAVKIQAAPKVNPNVPRQAETQTGPNTIDTLSITGDYLHRQEQQAFEKMVSEYGHKASMPSGANLSEMTPEMPRYEVKIIEDKTQPRSLNHRLDPNRIVKVGDTCYRVVNLSTQINPHGEGLGFARPCDPIDPTKRALDAAIRHRLSKMKSH